MCPVYWTLPDGELGIAHLTSDPGGVSVTLDSESVVHHSDHRDPLSSQNHPIPTVDNEILARQVQVFLEASEDVDVDAETIEDIISVLIDHDDDNNDNSDPLSEIHVDEDHDSHEGDSQEIFQPFLGLSDNAQTQGFPHFSAVFIAFAYLDKFLFLHSKTDLE